MAAMRSLGFTLGVLALAAGAFALGSHWATRGPGGPIGERVRKALADPDPIARATALVPLLRGLESSQIADVEAAYRESVSADGPREMAIKLLAEPLAALDPQGALQAVSTWPGIARVEAQNALLRAWARRNRVAAMEWVASISDDGTALEAVFTGWAEAGDPEMWSFVAAEIQPSMERESASIAMMQQVIAREGFDGLLARVDALPDDAPNQFKMAAIGTATGLVADHDPERALAFADRYAGTPYSDGLLRRIMIRWVPSDGAAALQHLLERPASQERDVELRDAYAVWLRRDRKAALAWIPESAPSDARFLPIAKFYAIAIARNDRENPAESTRRAIQWAEQISDPGRRRETLVQLGVLYLHHDPDAAAAWLAGNGLDADVRAEAARYQAMRRQQG